MWKFIKITLLSVIAVFLAATGAVAWALLTPVTESNVEGRLVQGCAVGMAAQALNNLNRSRHRSEQFTYGECQCMAAEAVRRLGPVTGVRLADATRLQIGEGLKNRLSGGPRRSYRDSPHAHDAGAMIAALYMVKPVCRAQATMR